jgi:hypothetical protein
MLLCRKLCWCWRSCIDWSGAAFYLAFSFFKNCGIVQGVAQRAAAGDASIAVADQEVVQLLPTILQ